MNKIECYINNKKYEIVIDKYKIIYGDNYSEAYEIHKCIKNYFNKTPSSEYQKENVIRATVFFNGNYIDVKNSLFFEVTPDFDYQTDAKLGTKSLLLKYLETCFRDIEYNDTFITIKELFKSLIEIEALEDISQNIGNIDLLINLNDLNFKTIVKLISPSLNKEGFDIGNNDLTYTENILLQLKLINKIADKAKEKIFVSANLPEINDEILNELNILKENEVILIFTNHFNKGLDIEKLVFSDLDFLDFENEEKIMDYLFELPYCCDVKDLKNKICNTLYSKKI